MSVIAVSVLEKPTYVKINDGSPNVTVTDNTKNTVQIIDGNNPVVPVEEITRINISTSGFRGPAFFAGTSANTSNLVEMLHGAIAESELSLELKAKITDSDTGLTDVRIDLNNLIASTDTTASEVDTLDSRVTQTESEITSTVSRVTNNEGSISAAQTKISQNESDILLSSSRLNSNEDNISASQIQISDQEIRLSSVEESDGANTSAVQKLQNDQWTVKIQQDINDNYYATGVGLILYPDWIDGKNYVVDDHCWVNDTAYICILDHYSTQDNKPFNATYWEALPYETKSAFGIMADTFYVLDPDGDKQVPFVVSNGLVSIDGNLLVNGSVQSQSIATASISMSHFGADTQAAVENTQQLWADILNTPESQVNGGITQISPGAILLYNGNTLANMDADDVPESTTNKWAAQSGATNDADIRHSSDVTMIDGGKIYTNSIAAAQIAANSISATHINVSTLSAISAAIGTITSGYLKSSNGMRFINLDATGTQLFIGCRSDTGVYGFYVRANGDAYFAGNLAANTVSASQITTGAVSSSEVNGYARLNGNRLNIIASGSVVINGGSIGEESATISHNLGRYVIPFLINAPDAVSINHSDTNSFTIRDNEADRNFDITVSYVYM